MHGHVVYYWLVRDNRKIITEILKIALKFFPYVSRDSRKEIATQELLIHYVRNYKEKCVSVCV